jgi:hypothetical protein
MSKVDTRTKLEQIKQCYPSVIRFNLEVTGEEPFPRSTNIAQMRWGGEEYGLYVEFFGYERKDGSRRPNAGYIYNGVSHNLWLELVAGVEAPDLSDDPHRRSTGRVFHEQVKQNANLYPFSRVI